MKILTAIAASCFLLSAFVAPALADDGKQDNNGRCKSVNGDGFWALLPPAQAPASDPYGRVLGATTGDLKASVTAYIVSFASASSANTYDIWVLSPTDMIFFKGFVTFSPIPGKAPDILHDDLTLTVTGGTGSYAGATGTVKVVGTAYNLAGPTAAPGQSYAQVTYKGSICLPGKD